MGAHVFTGFREECGCTISVFRIDIQKINISLQSYCCCFHNFVTRNLRRIDRLLATAILFKKDSLELLPGGPKIVKSAST